MYLSNGHLSGLKKSPMNFFFLLILFSFFHKTNTHSLSNEGVVISYQLIAKHYVSTEKRYTTHFKLFIEENYSLFIEDNLIKYFDLHNSTLSSQEKMNLRGTFDTPKFKFIVEKQKSNYLFLDEHYVGRNIAYTQPKMDAEGWNIQTDTVTIAGLMCYKALRELGGRIWIAWFAPELPFSDGPYKFSGLPGLIVRLESEDGDYKFSLTGIQKISDTLKVPKLPPYENVSQSKYYELKRYIMRNSTASFTDRGIDVKNLKWSGKEVTLAEYNELMWKEYMKMNFIEKFTFE